MRRTSLILVLVALVSSGAVDAGLPSGLVWAGGTDATLAALRADATDHDLYASFLLEEAFSPDVRERIDTGLPVTFTFYIEVARRRPLWFDKVLVRKTVSTTVAYDTLTHQYSLARKVNDEVTATSVAVDEADMMRWMTTLDRVRLADPTALGEAPDDSLYIRVKSRLQRRFVLFFIPWDIETGWEKVRLSLSREGTVRER